ncbi:sensor histidine kinase [Phytomonospora endophytica]|uniref:histidine kinase n=1 Tax=Phytomonospora endophytica TaxID=714109 RepID=A0A841FRB1_9ACTN|nr:histidine kinase [Phytomonospora endophytica]MBB6039831.1 signal transduction histidine kinase [Phytomonospora endophytica]GIG70315.1 two-component sensor histidine kinase [Phytomonospora endophytica]
MRPALPPAVCLFAAVVVGTLAGRGREFDGLALGLAAAACLPLLVRERWPLWTLGAVTAPSVVYHGFDYPHDALLAPVLVALYTVAAGGTRRRALTVGGILAVGVLAVGAATSDAEVVDGAGWMLAAVAFGAAVRAGRAGAEARERLRLARDVHDVLAHTITVAQVQAGVGAHLLDADRIDKARLLRVLETIVAASARAREELRWTLDDLRGEGGATPPLPAPDVSNGDGARTGTPVHPLGLTVDTDGQPAHGLPALARRALDHIVEESLTNAARHGAGPVAVRHTHRPGGFTTTVANDVRAGHGLTGMAERARAIGGTLTATYTVTLDVPWERA